MGAIQLAKLSSLLLAVLFTVPGSGKIISVIPAGGAAGDTCPTAGLVVAYDFNEGTGATAADSSLNGYDCDITGATWSSSGTRCKFSNCLDFDQVDDWCEHADNADLGLDGSSTGTWMAWVFRDDVGEGNSGRIADKGGATGGDQNGTGWALNTFTDLDVHLGINATSETNWNMEAGLGNFPNATLVHVAVTWEKDDAARFYLDGVLDGTDDTEATTTIGANAVVFRIGARHDGAREWDGTIDEFRMYNTELTAGEIAACMDDPI